mmetsp:Transcript_6634/g.11712  ORF Transcript_6634/g.11712 Transcript_6634/m.11712 type:complete len:275 (-) Transcript_6634:57-881(-)
MNKAPYKQAQHLFSYAARTGNLFNTSIASGDVVLITLKAFTFLEGCTLAELPANQLAITGGCGGGGNSWNVVLIDLSRDHAVINKPHIITIRSGHGAAYFEGYLYVIGGRKMFDGLKECERFSLKESRWEALSPLPLPCCCTCVIACKETESLYSLTGDFKCLTSIQRLSIRSLAWDIMPLKLPDDYGFFAAFRLDGETQIYFGHKSVLYRYDLLAGSTEAVKDIFCNILTHYGQSYFREGTLYCSTDHGPAKKYDIGSLPVVKGKTESRCLVS